MWRRFPRRKSPSVCRTSKEIESFAATGVSSYVCDGRAVSKLVVGVVQWKHAETSVAVQTRSDSFESGVKFPGVSLALEKRERAFDERDR